MSCGSLLLLISIIVSSSNAFSKIKASTHQLHVSQGLRILNEEPISLCISSRRSDAVGGKVRAKVEEYVPGGTKMSEGRKSHFEYIVKIRYLYAY
jgi:hypothetical protein